MATDIHEVEIKQVREHWEIYINGEFYCSTDSHSEALNEVMEACKEKDSV